MSQVSWLSENPNQWRQLIGIRKRFTERYGSLFHSKQLRSVKLEGEANIGMMSDMLIPRTIFVSFLFIQLAGTANPNITQRSISIQTSLSSKISRRGDDDVRIIIVKSFQTKPNNSEAADIPSPRTDANSMTAHQEFLAKTKKGRIDVYFEGDSITRRWGTSDEQYKHFLANWRQNFFGWNAADFGWGGDKTQHILWRLNNGELDNVNPKVIVLLAGTNNIGNKSPEGDADPRVDDVTRGIRVILDVLRRKAPGATIVLMGIFPRNDNMSVMPIINEINSRISKFADGKKVRYVNINDRIADKDGKLFDRMAIKDGLHLDLKAYQVWADALKPILTELLGPPAKEDHAPPPTGDPSNTTRSNVSHLRIVTRSPGFRSGSAIFPD